MVELWAYTSAYAARLADGLGSNPSAGTKKDDYVDSKNKIERMETRNIVGCNVVCQDY